MPTKQQLAEKFSKWSANHYYKNNEWPTKEQDLDFIWSTLFPSESQRERKLPELIETYGFEAPDPYLNESHYDILADKINEIIDYLSHPTEEKVYIDPKRGLHRKETLIPPTLMPESKEWPEKLSDDWIAEQIGLCMSAKDSKHQIGRYIRSRISSEHTTLIKYIQENVVGELDKTGTADYESTAENLRMEARNQERERINTSLQDLIDEK